MDFHIDLNAEDYRRARVLCAILKEHYSLETDESIRTVIATLEQQLKTSLDNPAYSQFAASAPDITTANESKTPFSASAFLLSLWNFITGPSQRELELGKQRKEQLERAEHAESTAFEVLAESADLKKALEEARRKIHQLETQLGHGPRSN